MQRIHISPSLFNILTDIKDTSFIANELLKIDHSEESLHPEFVNYISISDTDPTKLSYISNSRFTNLTSDQDPWACKGRYYARPGSTILKIFRKVSDKDVEIFNNAYKSAIIKDIFKFEIIPNYKIKDYYHYEIYSAEGGSLGNSCMKYDSCQRFFGLYSDNENISLLVMRDVKTSLIMGRALLWNFDSYKIMDRIYTINDEELSFNFKKWAIDNGYLYKHEQKWNNSLIFEFNGKKCEHKLGIQLSNWEYDYYPYLDTFKFLDKKSGILYNYIPHNDIVTLCDHQGRVYPSHHLCLDYSNNLFYPRSEMVRIFYKDGVRVDENVEIRVFSPNTEYSNVNDTYILRTDCIYDDNLNDYIFKPELDHLNQHDRINARLKEIDARNRERSRFLAKSHAEVYNDIGSRLRSLVSSDRRSRPRRISDEAEVVNESEAPLIDWSLPSSMFELWGAQTIHANPSTGEISVTVDPSVSEDDIIERISPSEPSPEQ